MAGAEDIGQHASMDSDRFSDRIGISKRHNQALSRLRRIDSLDLESNHATGIRSHGQALSTAIILRLAYESIGVVYGDIGTSPLYVFSSTFPDGLGGPYYKDDILGALCCIIYSLTLVPLIKYVLIVLWANDNGDGGTFALYSLICRYARVSLLAKQHEIEDTELSAYKLDQLPSQTNMAKKVKNFLENNQGAKNVLLFVALLGTCMVIGDGVLTPAISVLSAVGGIQKATPKLDQNSVVIISVVVLIAIFCVQRFGTSRVGFVLAPAVIIWFSFIGIIGLYNIFKHEPAIFKSFNPYYIYDYFRRNKREGWISLGGIVLCITGTEAMFADLGHFTVRSIQISFCAVAYPCLLLAYMGQAAYLMVDPSSVSDTFYKSIPSIVYWPQFVVAVAAAIIASQAMISATFTVVKQSMVLGCFPRVKIVHTSSKVFGQVYIPEMNWLLMIACIAVTAGFKNTTQLGHAYGIAVVGVMVVTTTLVALIMIMIWQTNLFLALLFFGVFIALDLIYFSAVIYKFTQGGYLPLAFASILLFVMYVWYYVSTKRYGYEMDNKLSSDRVVALVSTTTRVPGMGLVYTELVQGVPTIFAHMVENLPGLHQVVVLVSFKFLPITRVLDEERFLIRRVGPLRLRIYRCIARYGYRELCPPSNVFEEKLLDTLATFVTLDLGTTHLIQHEQREQENGHGHGHGHGHENEYKHRHEPKHKQEQEEPNNTSNSGENGEVASVQDVVMHEELSQEVEQEMDVLRDAREHGVVYLLGQSEVRAKSQSSLFKRFIIDYAFDLLRRNCRKGSVALNIPHQRLLEVGMIYNI